MLNNASSWLYFFFNIFLSNIGRLGKPYRYFLVVTKSCQSRCQNCKIWKETPEDELSLEELRLIAKKSAHLSWLNISGGEPTDRSDLFEIVEVFKRECPRLLFVNFTTNGLRPDVIERCVRRIASLGLAKFVVNVSIDGPPSVHDRIRGTRGNFDSAIETLKRIRGIPGVQSKASFTLHANNSSLVDETIAEVVARIPDFRRSDLHLNLPHQSGHFYGNTGMKMPLKNEELALRFEKFAKSAQESVFDFLGFFEKKYRRYGISYLTGGYKTPLPCAAMMSSVYISEKGELFPCTIWGKSLGSLRQGGYDVLSVLRSVESAAVRKQIERSECPNCWTPCEAFPTLLAHLRRLV